MNLIGIEVLQIKGKPFCKREMMAKGNEVVKYTVIYLQLHVSDTFFQCKSATICWKIYSLKVFYIMYVLEFQPKIGTKHHFIFCIKGPFLSQRRENVRILCSPCEVNNVDHVLFFLAHDMELFCLFAMN